MDPWRFSEKVDPSQDFMLLTALSQGLAGAGRWPMLARRILRALQPMVHGVEIGRLEHFGAPVAAGHRVDRWGRWDTERHQDASLWAAAQEEGRPITRGVNHDHIGPELHPWQPVGTAHIILAASVHIVGLHDGYVVLHLGPEAQGSPLMNPQCIDVVVQMITAAMVVARREHRVATRCRLAHQRVRVQQQRIEVETQPWGLRGHSPLIEGVRGRARQMAQLHQPGLITGEVGCGHWAAAQYVHQISRRASRPIVRFSCAGLPASGEINALCGAEGPLSQPHGGTVVLEGVEALSPGAQLSLAQQLADREAPLPAIIATTSTFDALRPELAWALATVHVHLPSLAERAVDVPDIVEAWLLRWASKRQRALPRVPQAVLDHLRRHPWPGNLAELEGALTRALAVGHNGELGLPDLGPPPSPETPVQTFEEAVKSCITAALKATGGSIYGPDGAAAMLGLNPSTLQSKMRKYRIRRAPFTQ
ncbi:MAG: sigma-54-dependent transcriptional regulator [Bradymonadia bacterium]